MMAIVPLLLAAWAAAAPAPELSAAKAWLNVPAPLSLKALRGKVVLLYFADDWSSSGRRATLAAQRLEASIPEGLVVIGVRTGPLQTLRNTVLRRELSHPVAADPDGALAGDYGVSVTPTLKLIDAKGSLAVTYGNSSKFSDILAAARRLVAEAKGAGVLDAKPIALALERDKQPEGLLFFPTRLFYDARSGRLYVADSGRNRILALDKGGRLLSVIGNGAVDYRDGPSAEAGFDHPEGIAGDGKTLFIADTVNDVLRRVDESGRVSTWVDLETLRWPRGLAYWDNGVFVAAAETHDVWRVEADGRAARYAGTGRPGRTDGALPAAQFEEPAALAVLDKTLWVADSHDSLRSIDLERPEVKTPELRGPGYPFSRPEALAAHKGKLLVADGGDGRLKSVDPKSGEVSVLADGLSQPSGVAVVGEEIVVADTGRSQLARFDARGVKLGTLSLKGLKPLPPGPPMSFLPLREDVDLPPAPIRADAEARLELTVEVPSGHKLNPRAPVAYRVSETRGAIRFVPETRKGFTFTPRFPLTLKFASAAGRTEALLNVDWYWCAQDGKGLCYSASKRYRVILDASPKEKKTAVSVVAKP